MWKMKSWFKSISLLAVIILFLCACGNENIPVVSTDLLSATITINDTKIIAKEMFFNGSVAKKRAKKWFLKKNSNAIAMRFNAFINENELYDASAFGGYNEQSENQFELDDVVKVEFGKQTPRRVYLVDHFINNEGRSNFKSPIILELFEENHKFQFVLGLHQGDTIPNGSIVSDGFSWRGLRLICEWDDCTTEYYFVLKMRGGGFVVLESDITEGRITDVLAE